MKQAQADLNTARNCLKAGDFYASAFFSQQSAEKALKGFLYFKGFRAIVTNSVKELLETSSEYETIFQKFLDMGIELDRHYIGSRYPNFYPSGMPYEYYNEEIASKCLSYAGSILKEVKKFLPK